MKIESPMATSRGMASRDGRTRPETKISETMGRIYY